jgi:hypothetical protein
MSAMMQQSQMKTATSYHMSNVQKIAPKEYNAIKCPFYYLISFHRLNAKTAFLTMIQKHY